jgi:hypothetical protein
MEDEDWAEYRMSAEYAYEVSYEPSEDPYDDHDDYMEDIAFAEYLAEQEDYE